MKVVVAQVNPIIGDLEGNTQKILQDIDRARARNPDIILFPELTICGYAPSDLLYHNDFIDAMKECLDRIVKATANVTVVVGLVRHSQVKGGKPLYNSAAIISDGRILGYYDKRLLPTYDVFNERRYFEPGKEAKTWEIKGKKVGVIICEDIWEHSGYTDTSYTCDPVADLVDAKLDLLLNLSASPYQLQKPDVRVAVCAKAARSLQCPVILCCQVGGNDDLIFDGYSVAVDRHGDLDQLGRGFEEDLFGVDLEAPTCHVSFHYDQTKDLFRALVLGVRDYFGKQGFTKGCLGLSGGIDSALVACIATEALGSRNVLAINMPSRYSTKETISDAELLAQNLGIQYKQIPIEKPFEDYLALLEPHFEGRPADVTEENIQARIRGIILMALSNKLDYIVLSTGNKSELGLGYCTLYGDMAGGLAVISDVLKTQVYDLCRWINRKKEIIPADTIERPPSAELRPDQKDLDSIPDYGIVDVVLKAYVEDYKSAEEIASQYPIPIEQINDLIRRLHRAEFKRRQAPIGIRVSKKAFSVFF